MKVVQILYSGLGGHGSVALSLRAAAREAGSWSDALVFVGIEPVLPEYERICRVDAIPFDYVPTVRGSAWQAWPALYRALERCSPEAIVLHSVKMIIPCALYARRRGIPLLAVEHQANALKRRSEWWVSRLLMRLADGVVVLTREYASQLQSRIGPAWRAPKVHLIPNGIDTVAFRPVARPADRPLTIGMASRITSIKRHDLLLEALLELCAKDGRDAWRLTLAGDGDLLPALRERAATLGLEDRISFPGYLGADGLREWFGSIDIYAHASEGETLSTSLLQALAMGLPIVGSDVPGITDLLSADGGCGLTVDQSAEAFASACARIAASSALADELRNKARARAIADFSQSAMFQRYDTLLRQLCAR